MKKNIKVQYPSRMTGGGYYGSRYTTYPKIQMEGKWLQELGFNIGERLVVECENGSIRISPAPQEAVMVAEPFTAYGKK